MSAQDFLDLQSALNRTLPQARIEVVHLEGTGLELGLINGDFPTGPLDPDVMHAVIADPAYWAFCWGSGLAMARWIANQPELVRDKTIGDLGCGSGVVAIAAARYGASHTFACDIDADALLATQANAAHNAVNVTLVDHINHLPDDLDLLFLADVLYDRSNFGLIEIAKEKATQLIIADSRVSDVEDEDFAVARTDEALTYPNLGEFDEFKRVRFFTYNRT